ncbi:MAG: hypothetical protein Kow00122_02140 [Thermoleophilia bacterium]
MGRMIRTQISLGEDEYAFVKSEADRRGVSFAELIRTLIDETMATTATEGADIAALAGLFADGSVSGADHDRLLADALEGERRGPRSRPALRSAGPAPYTSCIPTQPKKRGRGDSSSSSRTKPTRSLTA